MNRNEDFREETIYVSQKTWLFVILFKSLINKPRLNRGGIATKNKPLSFSAYLRDSWVCLENCDIMLFEELNNTVLTSKTWTIEGELFLFQEDSWTGAVRCPWPNLENVFLSCCYFKGNKTGCIQLQIESLAPNLTNQYTIAYTGTMSSSMKKTIK